MEHDHMMHHVHAMAHDHSEHAAAHAHAGHGHGGMGHMHHMEEMRRRFIVSLIVTVPILLFSPMLQDWAGIRFDFPYREELTALLATFIYLYGGKPFLTMTLDELKARQPGMMTLISMAITVAYGYSVSTLVFPGGKAFFWELATLIDVMLIGHYIEAKSILGASDALEDLVRLMPKTATRLNRDGTSENVDVTALQPGDLILVRPGENIAADGTVEAGESSVNEALLTGESKPIFKTAGGTLFMGALNLDGALRVRIDKAGSESYLSQVIALVKEAQQSRSHTQDLANRAAGWLFYAALAAGSATFAVWSLLLSPADAVLRGVTVLIIACPHALGLAVPLVVAISTSLAAKSGILIRNRQAFEALRGIDTICFDKTGTVTEGRLAVSKTVALEDDNEMLAYAAALERDSEHSIARAVTAYADSVGVRPLRADAFKAIPGIGASAEVDGRAVMVGGPQLIARERLAIPSPLQVYSDSASTTVWVIVDRRPVGVILLDDRIRNSSADAVATLKSFGIKTWMLTGDNEAVAASVADMTGIDRYRAGLLPDEKLAFVKARRAEGRRVAMVGDGVNDAPSLLGADIGIAVGAGTDIAIDSADIILTRSDLRSVVDAVRLSRRTYGKMKENLWWASGYNLVAIPLAAGVLAPWNIVIGPAFGAVLMSISTVIVALNAQLLKRAAH
ncbi:copper-translocating P-type ATPase [Sulfurimonas sp. HSL-3221]|uniref:copper-translocating P-type ATPase n=1 Tax=Sulfurimonadaceae TaxID=2771471 RepID=UPI001E3DABC8|nr:copper-translocating P-type ATPase [Sulfurimonas sp. HSL-3221]UFS62868.1 copper-translocating P-type ATPase [Sulfurimonas sp. HSL-3221]